MSSQPRAGIGVRLGDGLVAIDIDTDDERIRAKLVRTFLGPNQQTISRIGGRGELFFLRVHPGRTVASKKFPINRVTTVEVLASGKQCVLPPTRHPKGNLYRWGANGMTFYNTDLETIPEWPE